MQNKILVVDGDTRSLRLLEVSLAQVGYRVVTATSGADALSQLEVEVPDLVLADTDIGAVDGFALYQQLQARPEWAHLPFIFILDGENPAEKLRAVQLGASDFLTKPVFLKEALSRVELLLEKHAQRGDGGLGAAITSGRARFAGPLSGTAVLDLLQTMELGRKSGIAYCVSGRGQRAVLYFADGAVVDAEFGRRRAEEALYRVLTFQGGEYRVELLTVVRPRRIELGTAGLLMEAMRHLEEWNRLSAALPPLTTPLQAAALGGSAAALRPDMLPRELSEVLQCFDGQRSVLDVLDLMDEEVEPPHDALRRLGAVAKLYAARLLVPAGRPISGEPRAPVPTPIALPRLTPPPARLTPPPLPQARLTPPPLPQVRLTPPPLPQARLTPPPFATGRSSAMLASLGRPTPVALPRAVVFTPAPLAPAEHCYPTDVPTGPVSSPPAQASPMFSSDVPTGPMSVPPLHFSPPASASEPDAATASPQLATGQPGGTLDAAATDEYPTPLPRHCPPPSVRHTPVELMPVLPTARLTPPPLARLTPPPLARLTPPPLARLTPPPLPQARLTPPPLPQVRLTPPPIPGPSSRSTPPMLHAATPPASTPLSDATPPPIPGRPLYSTPPTLHAAPLPITDSMVTQLPSRPGRTTPPMLHTAQLTPLPITDSMVTQLPSRPGRTTPPMLHTAQLTPLPITDSMVTQLPSRPGRSTPPMLQAAPPVTPLPITDSMVMPLPITDSMVMPLPSRPERSTPPALRVAGRPTPPPVADEPKLAPEADLDGENSGDPSASSPGRNLARLAQRLAATRQPPPFTPPPLPNFVPAASSGHSEPSFGSATMWSSSGSGGQAVAPAAAVSWIGSAPELEPISIPEFEAAAEHSAPSWEHGTPASGGSAVPQREIKLDKTLPVHSRPQRIAAADSQAAVHISAPVRLPAELASTTLPPIELDSAAVRARPPAAPAPAVVANQRLGKVVAWLAAGVALFGVGVGLFWVRQELDRGPAEPPPERAWTTGASPSAPATGGKATPPAVTPPPAQAPQPTPAPTAAAATEAPSAMTPEAASPTAAPAAAKTLIIEPAAAPPPSAAPAAAAPPRVTAPPAATSRPNPPTLVAQSAAAPVVGAGAAPPAAAGEYAALIAKARTFERRGILSQAHHAIKDAQRLNPRGAEVFALLAQLALDEGDADKAAGLAKRALVAEPRSADAYLVLGTVEQARGHGAKAREYFKKYLTLAPTGDRAHDVRAVLRMSH